jgi:hypothetical protein
MKNYEAAKRVGSWKISQLTQTLSGAQENNQ